MKTQDFRHQTVRILVAMLAVLSIGMVFPTMNAASADAAVAAAMPGEPTIYEIYPDAGPAAGNDTVFITGMGLTDATAVNFGSTPGVNLQVLGDDTITVETPAHAGGLVPVSVVTPNGTVTEPDAYTFQTAPGAPRNLTGVSSNAAVTLNWLAPLSNGGADISAYTVTATPGGKKCSTTGALTCTVSGLTNGTPYTFTAKATNEIGVGVASAPSAPVTPSAAPGPVRSARVSAFPSSGAATLVWAPPASTGGAPLTGYRTRISAPNNPNRWGAWVNVGTGTKTFTGLVLGANYRVEIVATNLRGAGPSVSVPFRQPTAPSPVRSLRMGAWTGPGQASVLWVGPVNNGGSPVLGYKIRISGPNSSVFGPWSTQPGVNKAFSGLVRGAVYKVQVLTYNNQGDSLGSGLVFRQPNVPTAVTGVRIGGRPGPGQTTIVWSPPANNGGLPVTGYSIRITDPNSTTWRGWTNTTSLSKTFTGLTQGANYMVQIVAKNGAGVSPPNTGSFKQSTVPSTIRSPKVAFPAAAKVQVTWTAPSSDGGSPITTYRVRMSKPNSTTEFGSWVNTRNTSQTYGGMVKNANYRVEIVAANSQGSSAVVAVLFKQAK